MNEDDCAARAKTSRGSSRTWSNQTSLGGLVSRCCFFTRFCQFHRVYIKSCDGLGFAGSQLGTGLTRKELQGRTISTGQATVRATIDMLVTRFGLADALDVLVAGCSAGGRAAMLHAPSIRDTLRSRGAQLRKFKVLGLGSIFFPNVPAPSKTKLVLSPAFAHMRTIALQGNLTGDSEACRSRWSASESWRCSWGMEPIELMPPDIPVFLVQSVFDLWQTSCVLAAGHSSSTFEGGCSGGSLGQCLKWGAVVRLNHGLEPSCTDQQLEQINRYQQSNIEQLVYSPALRRPGYGGYFHGCHDHCTTADSLVRLVIGNISAREAMHRWFHGDDTAPVSKNTRWGCIPERRRESRQSSTVVRLMGNASNPLAEFTGAVPYGQCR